MSDYPDHFVRRLEILWGRGFMSPGGREEVREILRGIEAAGKTVLDIGCGIGGPALVIARELGAARVTAIDVAGNLVDRARSAVREEGLEAVIDVRLAAPGPLGFPDGTFDVVFSKDTFLHVADKRALFAEIRRVLKPGGVLAYGDWLASEDRDAIPAWRDYQNQAPYPVNPATAAECAAHMRAAGFADVSARDRNEWYAALATAQLALIEGALKDELVAASSPAIYDGWARMRRAQTAAVVAGALRPTHLKGFPR